MGFFHKSEIIQLEVCVVPHNYAIQFLLVSKLNLGMQCSPGIGQRWPKDTCFCI